MLAQPHVRGPQNSTPRGTAMKRLIQVLTLLAIAAPAAHAGRVPPVVTTPEPMTLGLVAGGIAVLGAGAWFKNRKR